MRPTSLLCLQASAVTAAAASLFTPPTSLARRGDNCECYLTNGSSPEYYTSHLFFDFRSLSKHASIPKVATSFSENAKAPIANDYFESDDWKNTWQVQDWNNSKSLKKGSTTNDPKIPMTNSFSNVYIEGNTDEKASSETYLTMRTKRLEKFQTSAEFESIDRYHYLSVRMLARTIGSPGAITALFTYRGGGSLAKVQEADIEVLTRGPRNHISYTNQPSYTEGGDDVPKATQNATLPNGKEWSEWLVHRLDWTPNASIWYVDGVQVAKIEFQTPRDPSQVVLNTWSDGGEWSGKMALNDEAYMQIQWIDMVFNKTGKSGEDKRDVFGRRDEKAACGVVCSVDEGAEVGKAVEIKGNEIKDNASSRTGLTWVASVMVLAVLTASLA